MKKLISLLFVALLLLCCGNKTEKTVSNTDSLAVDSMVADAGIDKHSEAYIRQRIDTIYKGVGKSTYDSEYLRETIRQGLKIREQAKALVGYWGWVGDDGPELLLRLEMNGKGLEVTECNIYRLYGFDKATASFNGTYLIVEEMDYDEEAEKVNHEFYFSAHLDKNGDLTGNCRIKHPLASRNYDGPLTLRKDYFKYRDGAKRNLSDYAE